MAVQDHIFQNPARQNRANMRRYTGFVQTVAGGVIAYADTPFFDVSKVGTGLYRVKLLNSTNQEVFAVRLGALTVTLHEPAVGVPVPVYADNKAVSHYISDFADPSGTVVGPGGAASAPSPFSRFDIQFFRTLTAAGNTTYLAAELADGVAMFLDFSVKQSKA